MQQPLSMSRSRDGIRVRRDQQGILHRGPFTVSYQCTGFVVNPDSCIATAGHVPTTTVRPRTRSRSGRRLGRMERRPATATLSKETRRCTRNWRDGADSGTPRSPASRWLTESACPAKPTGTGADRSAAVRPRAGEMSPAEDRGRGPHRCPLVRQPDTGVGTEVVASAIRSP